MEPRWVKPKLVHWLRHFGRNLVDWMEPMTNRVPILWELHPGYRKQVMDISYQVIWKVQTCSWHPVHLQRCRLEWASPGVLSPWFCAVYVCKWEVAASLYGKWTETIHWVLGKVEESATKTSCICRACPHTCLSVFQLWYIAMKEHLKRKKLSWSSKCSHAWDAGLPNAKRQKLTPGVNYLGKSIVTRWLYSVMLARVYSGKKMKNKPLLRLIEHLALDFEIVFSRWHWGDLLGEIPETLPCPRRTQRGLGSFSEMWWANSASFERCFS